MPKRKERNPNDFYQLVKDDFGKYEEFRTGEKQVSDNPIQMTETKKQSVFLGKSMLSGHTLDCPRYFEAELCDYEILKYSIKVFAKEFGGQPCLRFDSRGGDHINEEDGSGLFARVVPCPHFHRVREDGWNWAYHTADLADPIKGSLIATDFTFGKDLACKEFNVIAPEGGDTVLLTKATSIFQQPSGGALDNAQFP